MSNNVNVRTEDLTEKQKEQTASKYNITKNHVEVFAVLKPTTSPRHLLSARKIITQN